MAHAASAPPVLPAGSFWVFGYGSLMWNPGFTAVEVHRARLHGYHRWLCVWSWTYRGTRANPGLVLGLDRGGSCLGRAFRVRAGDRAGVVDYLYARELISDVYRPVLRCVRLEDGRRVRALTFVVDRCHAQYAGKLSPERAAAVVRGARGVRGPNHEYVINTAMHLRELGAPCVILDRVRELLVEPARS
ncbi:MAG: gamma-glutamylcyclotransferase [Gammaproteobacteria bacterium]|nr:gamma-glutamylcyclotransferase [Gammaproteobacteria bacterium]NIR84508.1 gamma-glutamylcyclotransferase [Gammaproteobacteria bacterium]NIR90411.1 gamma-glutamylcyclotransferase [Gammaproteobacteria bacterium]NIU05559.1 gamma-glutamylcyclotransferase [Gammaproteobacteria bacterium]NIV52698.1 gamma-glutamylcyclotransferase [Gammaproteobacteria bacterium]